MYCLACSIYFHPPLAKKGNGAYGSYCYFFIGAHGLNLIGWWQREPREPRGLCPFGIKRGLSPLLAQVTKIGIFSSIKSKMIQSLLLQLVLAFLLSFLGVYAEIPAPPRGLNDILEMTRLTITSGLIGGVLIAVGLLLCFAGKRFFKVFLAIVGFATGAIIGFTAMGWIQDLMTIPNGDMVTYVVAGVLGLLLAAACMLMWKIGVYVGAGLGGYALMSYILGLRIGGLIENGIGRVAALLLGAGVGVITAMFLEDLAIAVASSMAGALGAVCGLDCFLNTGFRAQIYDQAIRRAFALPEAQSSMYFMYAGVAGLTILGIVVQLLVAPSKGFGRGG